MKMSFLTKKDILSLTRSINLKRFGKVLWLLKVQLSHRKTQIVMEGMATNLLFLGNIWNHIVQGIRVHTVQGKWRSGQ